MEIVRAEAGEVPAPAAAEGRREPWWRSLGNLALRPAAGFALVAVLVAGVTAGYLVRGSDSSDPATSYVRVTGVGPEADNVSGVLERTGDSATLHVHEMPKLARDQVYEVWVQRAGVMEPKSLFVLRRDGTAEAAVPGPLDGGEAVYVTTEKRGGAQTPTLPALLEAPL
jgi:anti-sigma-K factor RskA